MRSSPRGIMRNTHLLLLSLVLACARVQGPSALVPGPRTYDDLVDYVTHFNSVEDWEHSRWYDMSDPEGANIGFFVVSTSRAICLNDPTGAWVVALHGEPFHCYSPWRAERNPNGATGSIIPNEAR